MSQELNQYGSVEMTFANDDVAPHITALGLTENTKGKRTLKTKSSKKIVFAEPVAVVAVAEPVAPQEITITTQELATMLQAHEDRISKLENGQKRKGFYTVEDGDEELCRVRLQNKELRKEIEAKTKTNQDLRDQLEDASPELTRQKEINKALRKENEGLTKTNKALKAQMTDSNPELERLRRINADLRKEADAAARGRKKAYEQVRMLQALLKANDISFEAEEE
jgi:predicted RNase H-like nuclease (RuvC/YqgF family)